MNLEKTVSAAKKLLGFFRALKKVLFISCIAAAAVLLVLTVVKWAFPEAVIGTDYHMIDIGPFTFELAEDRAPEAGSVLRYARGCVLLAVLCAAVGWYALGCVCSILQPMSEGTPFPAASAQSFKKLAWCGVAMGVAVNASSVLQTASALRMWDISALLAGGGVTRVTANYTLDLSFLVVFFLLMLMHHVFAYAAQLQQLSDETL